MWASVPELTPREVGTPIPVDPHVPIDSYTYDYIIVGGGTAGCVLASRLTEDPSVSVLLIEQGPVSDTWLSRVPLISGNIYSKDNLSSRWWSLPLRNADNRYLEVVRGEALGGATRVNGMLYTRGCPGDYNQWRALGNEGWGYDDLEPYFVKSENSHSHSSRYRGKGGVWQNRQVSDSPYEISKYIDRSVQKAGIPHVPDVNVPDVPAAHTAILDIIQDKNFHRNSIFLAFLPPQLTIERQSRLKICTNTVVCRIELATESSGALRATGVHIETTDSRKADHRYVAKARREVIVCAGALGSPQVLMLSGVGPRAHLEERQIPVVVDLPAVGSHLSDHMGVPVAIQIPLDDSLHHLQASWIRVIFELFKYVTTGGGIIGRPFQNSSSFFPSRLIDPTTHTIPAASARDLDASLPENRPDIEFMHTANNCADVDPQEPIGVFSFLITLIRPRSEGTVRLATANPRVPPAVDLNFLADPADYVPLRKGIRLALRVFDDVRAQGYPVLGDLQVPPGGADADDATMDAFIRTHLRTNFHYTSTCRMGASADGARPSVVDAALRVHGVRGLRVCDASVFPEIIGSHTMAPTVAVAEKCADMIKASCYC